MSIQRKSRSFKDISLSFSPHPVTRDLPVLVNERAIVRSVRNLVETMPTERFFQSLIGTEVRRALFENFSRGTLVTIEDQIKETIENFEPRVDMFRLKHSLTQIIIILMLKSFLILWESNFQHSHFPSF